MKHYQQLKKELLKNKNIREAYQKLEPEFVLIRTIIRQRVGRGLTQKELALRMGTKQSAIARLESGRSNPTISFLHKLANALDVKLKISLS